MTSGTRVLVVAILLFVGVIAVYYGFVLPGEDTPVEPPTARTDDPLAARPEPKVETPKTPVVRTPPAPEPEPETVDPRDRLLAQPGRVPVEIPGATPRLPDPRTDPRESDTAGPRTPRDETTPPVSPVPPSKNAPPAAPQKSSPPAPDVRPPAPVETPVVTPAPEAEPETRTDGLPPGYTWYVVEDGDTMSSIARAHYGRAAAWERIAKANLVDPNRLVVGQRLRLPPADERPVAPAPAPRELRANEHRVAEGETLTDIADIHYGSTARWRAIYEANRDLIGSNPDRLKVGMVLTIPK